MIINYVTEASDIAATALALELQQQHSVRALPIRADITSREKCEQLVATARSHFANFQIDILVHNAAIVYLGPFEEVKESEFQQIYNVNVLGPILVTAACKPYLPNDRSGRIVLLSSINSKVGTEMTTLYSGTKGAIEAMARVWCRELAERATVNTINPGPVMADMYFNAPENVKKVIARWNPLTPLSPVRECDTDGAKEIANHFGGRAAYPEEIAGLVASICNPEFGWCTGSIISANGGLSMSI